ncbi:MAG TPA: multidrug ABC transporter ATP-binding protein [Lachnospiraceae bacterium]|nr:multidrug ABC transporter ATP-binding protein [Lachnospiraceae bacterium]
MIIDVKDVSLKLKENKILECVSLQCDEGEICGIIGRNGSGKTMLMKCVCGFVRPTDGEILVLGKRIGKDVDFIPDAGIIIETPGFIPYYSGIKNLRLLASIQNKIKEPEIKKVMEMVGLNPDMKRMVKKYSLGMRQRLGLAQAVMENPKVLIFDEPFNGLDKEGVADMRKYLLKLKGEGKTILLSSHSTEDIELLCDKVYEMEHGKLEAVEK